LVSIGLPTYNRAATLRRAIESALNQDYQNIELLISDNGSADETEALCLDAARHDNRVKYLRQQTNQGATANFREVLKRSGGAFFMFLGDDDWLDSSYVSRCTQKLIENPDYSLVCGGAKYYQNGQLVPDEGETIDLLQDCPEERVLDYYKQVKYNSTFAGVMRRVHLHFALENVLGGDWLFIAAIAFVGKIETIKEVSINRGLAGSSRSLKALTATLGISRIHALMPKLSIAVSACRDVAWRSRAYGALSRWERFSLAHKVFSVFYQRYWRVYRTHPIRSVRLFRNNIRKLWR